MSHLTIDSIVSPPSFRCFLQLQKIAVKIDKLRFQPGTSSRIHLLKEALRRNGIEDHNHLLI